jgi:hypothetical protein
MTLRVAYQHRLASIVKHNGLVAIIRYDDGSQAGVILDQLRLLPRP